MMDNNRTLREGILLGTAAFLLTTYYMRGGTTFFEGLILLPFVFLLEIGVASIVMLILDNYVIEPLGKWLKKGSTGVMLLKKAVFIIPLWLIAAFVASGKEPLRISGRVLASVILAVIILCIILAIIALTIYSKRTTKKEEQAKPLTEEETSNESSKIE